MPNVLRPQAGRLVGGLCVAALLLCVARMIYSYAGATLPDEAAAGLLAVEQEVGERPADGSVQEIPFEVVNRSRSAVTVVGFTGTCVERCCARVLFAGSVTLAPGGKVSFVAEVKVGQTGPFAAEVQAYADCGGLCTFPVILRGIGK